MLRDGCARGLFVTALPVTAAQPGVSGRLLFCFCVQSPRGGADWPAYGGGPEAGTRYSALQQINRGNVGRLRMVWSYDTDDGAGDPQTQPIMVDGVLYGLTPRHKVVALNAATGKLIWRFDSGIVGRGANRSVVYWNGRIFAGVQSFVYAIDAHFLG